MCHYYRGVLISEGGIYVKALMELGPEDVSLLERCPQKASSNDMQNCDSHRLVSRLPFSPLF